MEGAMKLVADTQTTAQDMNALVGNNSCDGAGLKQFQQNLMRYALNKQPQALAGGAPRLAAEPKPVEASGPFKDSNYAKLMDDLVSEQSRMWAMNRYQRGSMTAVRVAERDPGGRPSKLTGSYRFVGFSGQRQGTVTLDFSEGAPHCLYFFDFPSVCRAASRQIAATYVSGGYRE